MHRADWTMFSHERLLEAEIEFWREMIDSQPTQATPALERMAQALALAQDKLALARATTPDSETGRDQAPFGSTAAAGVH